MFTQMGFFANYDVHSLIMNKVGQPLRTGQKVHLLSVPAEDE